MKKDSNCRQGMAAHSVIQLVLLGVAFNLCGFGLELSLMWTPEVVSIGIPWMRLCLTA